MYVVQYVYIHGLTAICIMASKPPHCTNPSPASSTLHRLKHIFPAHTSPLPLIISQPTPPHQVQARLSPSPTTRKSPPKTSTTLSASFSEFHTVHHQTSSSKRVPYSSCSRRLGGWLAFVGESVGECGAIDGVDGWREIGRCQILR